MIKNGYPTTKAELLEMIKDFLICDSNLRTVFMKFGKMHGNEDSWELEEIFLKHYRFLGKYIKLRPLIQDLFEPLN